jgi:hypothetical protein
MPRPRPLNVVVGAPVTFDLGRCQREQQRRAAAAAAGAGARPQPPAGGSEGGGSTGERGEAGAPPEGEEPGQTLEDMVDAYHQQYIEALQALYDAHKEAFDKQRRRSMRIVE